MRSRVVFWCVAALIGLLFCARNLPWRLDGYDQAKQAFTSFEMVEEGHWLYQSAPNENIATKPPLVGWVSAACYAVTRSWEIAWRFPSIAAAIALVIVMTGAAADAYGREAGLLAMSAFGLNMFAPRLATLVRTDMPLTFVVFLLGLQIWRKIRNAERWTARDRLVAFALLTAAMWIKGPIIYAFLLPGIAAFQLGSRFTGTSVSSRAESRDLTSNVEGVARGNSTPLRFAQNDNTLREMAGGDRNLKVSGWCGWWPWIGSLAVFLLWAGIGIARVPGFYEQVVLREFAGRFSETVHRSQPFFFYWPHLLHKFAPWSILIIIFAIILWRMDKMKWRERWNCLSPETKWLICWSVGGLLFMSVIPSKRVDRIFPIVPSLCLLLAAQFAALSANQAARARRWGAVALLIASVFGIAYVSQQVVRSYRAKEDALAQFGSEVCREAAAQHWRLAAIGGKEDGLAVLLYLRLMHFLQPEEAARRWNARELDALVIPSENEPDLLRELHGATAAGLEAVGRVNDRPRRFVLLKKAGR